MSEPTSVAGDEDQSLELPCSTTFEIPGRAIERYVGLCWGLTVRSVGLAKGITGAVRSLKPARSSNTRTSSSKPVTTRSSVSSSTPSPKAPTP